MSIPNISVSRVFCFLLITEDIIKITIGHLLFGLFIYFFVFSSFYICTILQVMVDFDVISLLNWFVLNGYILYVLNNNLPFGFCCETSLLNLLALSFVYIQMNHSFFWLLELFEMNCMDKYTVGREVKLSASL